MGWFVSGAQLKPGNCDDVESGRQCQCDARFEDPAEEPLVRVTSKAMAGASFAQVPVPPHLLPRLGFLLADFQKAWLQKVSHNCHYLALILCHF